MAWNSNDNVMNLRKIFINALIHNQGYSCKSESYLT